MRINFFRTFLVEFRLDEMKLHHLLILCSLLSTALCDLYWANLVDNTATVWRTSGNNVVKSCDMQNFDIIGGFSVNPSTSNTGYLLIGHAYYSPYNYVIFTMDLSTGSVKSYSKNNLTLTIDQTPVDVQYDVSSNKLVVLVQNHKDLASMNSFEMISVDPITGISSTITKFSTRNNFYMGSTYDSAKSTYYISSAGETGTIGIAMNKTGASTFSLPNSFVSTTFVSGRLLGTSYDSVSQSNTLVSVEPFSGDVKYIGKSYNNGGDRCGYGISHGTLTNGSSSWWTTCCNDFPECNKLSIISLDSSKGGPSPLSTVTLSTDQFVMFGMYSN